MMATTRRTLAVVLLGALPTLMGCLAWSGIRRAASDSLDEGFTSVVILHLRLTDRAGIEEQGNPSLTLSSGPATDPLVDWPLASAVEWTEVDGIPVVDAVFVLQARPGEFSLEGVTIGTGRAIYFAPAPFRFTVPPDAGVDLGLLDVVTLGQSASADGRQVIVQSVSRLLWDAAVRDADHRVFEQLQPGLARRFATRFLPAGAAPPQ